VNAGSQAGGGGIWAEGGQIVNCQVVANQNVAGAFNGGGIYANNTQIINCQILSNTNSATSGGGIAATSASTLIRNCLIASNRTSAASTYGGGVYGGRIESSTIAGNSAANATGTYGGGVYGSVVTNSIVVNNTTGLGSNPNYDPTSTFAYSCASPKPAGAGNIDTVAFVNAPAGDYRLVASPAVDSGTNLAWMGGRAGPGREPADEWREQPRGPGRVRTGARGTPVRAGGGCAECCGAFERCLYRVPGRNEPHDHFLQLGFR
jgi:hypothetical protein